MRRGRRGASPGGQGLLRARPASVRRRPPSSSGSGPAVTRCVGRMARPGSSRLTSTASTYAVSSLGVLLVKAKGGLVAVVAVGDQEPPADEAEDALELVRILDRPEAAAYAVELRLETRLADRLGRRRPLVQEEDGRELRARRAQQLEAAFLLGRKRALVRQDDAVLVGMESHPRGEAAATARRAVRLRELLLEDPDRRRSLPHEHAPLGATRRAVGRPPGRHEDARDGRRCRGSRRAGVLPPPARSRRAVVRPDRRAAPPSPRRSAGRETASQGPSGPRLPSVGVLDCHRDCRSPPARSRGGNLFPPRPLL